jgi:hypothetical protein
MRWTYYIYSMKTPSYTKDQLRSAVEQSTSYRQVHMILGLKGYNYKSILHNIEKHEIDASHFIGRDGLKLEDILVENSPFTHTSHLRNKLFKHKVKKPQCETCNLTDWLGKPIQFHLHHLNGVNNDNRITNLQIICPNCHSQTPNFGSKNKNSAKHRAKVKLK